MTPRTINYELRCLFTFFRWAVRQNYLFVNPVTNIEKIRVPKRSLPRFMTSDDIRKFFVACRENERDIADLLGHKHLATTQIYAKVQQEHLRSVVGKLTGLASAATETALRHSNALTAINRLATTRNY